MNTTTSNPTTWELNLPDKLRSLNELRTPFQRNKDSKAWENVIHNELYYLGIRAPTTRPAHKVRLTITRLMAPGERPFDRDNLVGGAKSLLDALKRETWIRDDNEKWLEVEYLQAHAPPGQRGGTRLRLEPA